MTVDEFFAWAGGQDGHWELQDDAFVAMPPELLAHTVTKGKACSAIEDSIAVAKAPCRALIKGASVRVREETLFVPDVLVYCGVRRRPDAFEILNPVIVVEVRFPVSAARDHGAKFEGYFSLPSIVHYLILDADERMAIHYKRGRAEIIETRILRKGVLRLDPPGLAVPIAPMFPPP